MGDHPEWFSWARIIDPTKKPASWWGRHKTTLATSISLLSLLVAATLLWYARKSLISGQAPLLEIVEGMKDGESLLLKNSGRSSALKVRNEIRCEIGQFLADQKGPAGFHLEFSMPTGITKVPDIPMGGTFPVGAFIPWKGLSKEFDAHYTDDSSVRLIGILKYEDAEHNQYERPWCYESVRPKGTDKPGFFPCWYMDRF